MSLATSSAPEPEEVTWKSDRFTSRGIRLLGEPGAATPTLQRLSSQGVLVTIGSHSLPLTSTGGPRLGPEAPGCGKTVGGSNGGLMSVELLWDLYRGQLVALEAWQEDWRERRFEGAGVCWTDALEARWTGIGCLHS